MLVLSHRGYHVEHPENTLAAFRAALEWGVDGIETDIRLSADGVPVLLHDHLTADGRTIDALTHAEMNQLRGHRIPTLTEALELAVPNPARFIWNLEIKTPAAVETTIDLIRRFGDRRRILVTSFWHPVVAEVSRQVDVECGLLICARPIWTGQRPDWIPSSPHITTLVWNWEFTDSELVAASQAQGLQNFVYGVTTRAEHEAARQMGLTGIITDRPEFASPT
ncbi:MAG: glycerophosphodiester phosphodiesterase [Planctomycetes bacterium]|nr:glycerophosphodiester phosphodiesterase [Planctomycetota bacterium]